MGPDLIPPLRSQLAEAEIVIIGSIGGVWGNAMAHILMATMERSSAGNNQSRSRLCLMGVAHFFSDIAIHELKLAVLVGDLCCSGIALKSSSFGTLRPDALRPGR